MVTKANGHADAGSDDDTGDGIPVTIGDEGEVIYPDGDGIPTIDPSTITSEPDSGEPARRGRGRPRGSRTTTSAKQQKEKASDLTAILMSLHMMGAALLSVPELELDKAEAEKLGAAINRVQEFYDDVPVLTDEQRAWINLAIVAGTLYGPRFFAHGLRTKNEQAEKGPQTIDAQPVRIH